jgi:hypothetical protein
VARAALEEDEVRAILTVGCRHLTGEDRDLRTTRPVVVERDGVFALREDRPRDTVGPGRREGHHRLRIGIVPIVGTALAALGRRLPRVPGVAELTLGQLVESFLLAAEHVELVLVLLGLDRGRIERRGVTSVGLCSAAEQST